MQILTTQVFAAYSVDLVEIQIMTFRNQVATSTSLPFYQIFSTFVVSGYSGPDCFTHTMCRAHVFIVSVQCYGGGF